ncbi:hypothetical protein BJV82DRAFT_607546 [Fennellomyces sp. T-0311]|nr:hypothetical protein BJV82DRAFT_607546 [Fennellomyces sp. T-0311]
MPQTSYYCHHCQSNTSVFRVPLLVCGACQSPFVEEVEASESTTANEQARDNATRSQRMDDNHSVNSVMTDDGDENYEDIEEDSDSELHPWRQYYSEPDLDEEDDLQPWRNYYRRAVEEVTQSRRYPPNSINEYDNDRYYDEIYECNSRLPTEELDRMNHSEHHHHYHNHDDGPTTSIHDVFEQLISMFYGVTSESGEFENPWNALLHDLLQTRDGSVQRVAATAGQIEKLKKRKLEESDADVEMECIICQEPYGTQNEIIEMPCKHEYHGKCIRQWLGISTTCPMCRSSLPTEEEASSNTPSQPQEEVPFSRTFEFDSPSQGRTLVDIWVANSSVMPSAQSPYDDIDDDYDEDIATERNQNQPNSTPHIGQPSFGFCPHGFSQVQNRTRTVDSQNQLSHQTNPMDELD